MKVEHLFSTPLYIEKYQKHELVKPNLFNLLLADIKNNNTNRPDKHWNCNSYKTFVDGQFDLEIDMHLHIDNYLRYLGFTSITYKTESWFNMYGVHQYQEDHNHIPALFSGMYVLNFNEQHTPIIFRNRNPELNAIYIEYDLQPANFPGAYQDVSVNLEEGFVYIWPGCVRHSVPPQPKIDKNNYRDTFTFNVIATR